jgi:hypothetical protein
LTKTPLHILYLPDKGIHVQAISPHVVLFQTLLALSGYYSITALSGLTHNLYL